MDSSSCLPTNKNINARSLHSSTSPFFSSAPVLQLAPTKTPEPSLIQNNVWKSRLQIHPPIGISLLKSWPPVSSRSRRSSSQEGQLRPTHQRPCTRSAISHQSRIVLFQFFSFRLVYLAAVLQYLTSEILELAGETAHRRGGKRIVPRDLQMAIRADDE